MLLCAAILLLCGGCKQKEEEKKAEKESEVTELVLPKQEEEQEEEPEVVPLPEGLTEQLQSLMDTRRSGGEKWAVYIEDVESGANLSLGSEQMESASIIKLFTAVTVFEHLEEMTSAEGYAGETINLVREMIRVSDNEANNELVRRLGKGDPAAGMNLVNAFCMNNGYAQTHMGRLMLDFDAQDDNYTTVEDCGRLVAALCRNQYPGSEEIVGFMKEQERRGKIPAGLPSGVVSGNKTGELTDVENDVAFVEMHSGSYVVCIMSNAVIDPAGARGLIVEMSDVIYENMLSY